MKNAPSTLWLQTEGADPTYDKTCMNWNDLYQSRITWNTSKVYDTDLMYIKAPQRPEFDEMTMLEIADAMRKHGGGFIKLLGALIYKADVENKNRLLMAFPEFFEQYNSFLKD